MNSLGMRGIERRNHYKKRFDLSRQKELLEGEFKQILNDEEEFFSKQEGMIFLSKSGNRIWEIISYRKENPYCDCGTFVVNMYEKGILKIKNKDTTCYNVFGHDFDVTKLSKVSLNEITKANSKEVQ